MAETRQDDIKKTTAMIKKSKKSNTKKNVPEKAAIRKNILIIGATRTLGRKLVQIMAHDKFVHKIIGVSHEEMPYYFQDMDPDRFQYYQMNILKYREMNNFFLSDVYKWGNINTIIHLAHVADPEIYNQKSHVLNVTGTRNILERVMEDSNIKKFIFLSHPEVYKLKGENDVMITEENELNFDPDIHPLVKDCVDAELLVRSRLDAQSLDVVILRPSGIIGRNIRTDLNRLFESNFAVTLMGYNPMINPIHIRDVITAVRLCVQKKVRGVFNLGGKDIAPLSTFLEISEVPHFPVPEPLVSAVNGFLKKFALTRFDSAVNPKRLKFSLVLDYSKAQEVLGWSPQEHIKFS